MAERAVEFFFDVGSPASYLAFTQLPALCAQTQARLIYKPMLLGGVFKATGNSSPASVPAKGLYTAIDFARFAKRYGVPFEFNPHFPLNTLQLMRAVVGMQLLHPDQFERLTRLIFDGIWSNAMNLNDLEVLAQWLSQGGFNPADIVQISSRDEVKEALKANTEEAVSRMVFGAPTLFVGQEMFFGQDRLDFVKEALLRS
ncbi:MAG TPA: 2-hydroxychromene-2-carboxylate isomerase [Aquabacterium sp.]|nr:2-hydroxychromene-2-carboxylate isomerase [Aquabacterium sp.]